MRKFEKRLILLLGVLLMATLTACSPGGQDQPPEPEDGVLIYAALDPLPEDRSELIEKFNKTHEDVQIEVRDYSDENGVQRLLTELMLGRVPDIMEMHRLGEGKDTAWMQMPYEDRPEGEYWMPYRQMAQKGYLEDLWPYIEEDPELGKDGVLMPPLKAAEVNGGLYMFFWDVSVTTMISPSRLVGDRSGWTMEEMLETFSSMPEGSTILRWNSTRADVFSMLCAPLLDQYVDWETGRVSFDGQGFRDMISFLGSFPDECKTFLSQEDVEAEIVERMLTGHQLLEAVTVAALWYLPTQDKFFGERAAYVGYPTADGSLGSYFNLHGRPLAMSSACRNKEAAWDFMRLVFAKRYNISAIEEMHNRVPFQLRIPVIRYNYEQANRYDLSCTDRENWLIGPLGRQYFIEGPTTKDHLQRFEALVNNTTQIYWPDEGLSEIVWETIGPYFAGDRPLDETIDLVQNRAQLYVNEQK